MHKVKENDYLKRTMKRLNSELSPLKDDSTKDPFYIRDMWSQTVKNTQFKDATSRD